MSRRTVGMKLRSVTLASDAPTKREEQIRLLLWIRWRMVSVRRTLWREKLAAVRAAAGRQEHTHGSLKALLMVNLHAEAASESVLEMVDEGRGHVTDVEKEDLGVDEQPTPLRHSYGAG